MIKKIIFIFLLISMLILLGGCIQETTNPDGSTKLPIETYATSHYVEIMNVGDYELIDFCAILNDKYKQCLGNLAPNELNYMEYIYFEDETGNPIGKLIIPKKIKFTARQGWTEHYYNLK